MKQKIVFEESDICKIGSNKQEYQSAILEVLDSNNIKDDDSIRFDEITSNFPAMKIKRSFEDSELILKRSKLGMYTAKIKVNGFECKVMIDTGAEISVFADNFLESIDIYWNVEDDIEVSSFNDTKDNMNVALVNNLQIGEVEISNCSVLVIGSNKLIFKPLGINIFEINGIIGWDILSKLDFEIDYRNRLFTVLCNSEEESGTPMITSSFPSILLSSTDNKPIVVGLDTGARKSWISEKTIDKFDLQVLGEKDKNIFGAHGKERVSLKIIKSFEVLWDGRLISFLNVRTGYTGFLNGYEYDCVVGNDLLNSYSIRVINSKSICRLCQNNIS